MLDGFGIDPSVWPMLRSVGVPLILISFYVDGLIVGKVFPPAALYIAYVGLVPMTTVGLLVFTAGCVVASSMGQWTLYRWLRRDPAEVNRRFEKVPYLLRLAAFTRKRLGKRRMVFISRSFDRFGGYAISLTNAIPGIRSLMTIPAGLNQYPQNQFVVYSTLGNTAYLALLWLVAQGVVRLAGFFPTP